MISDMILQTLAAAGFLSLYLVIASIVYKAVYSKLKGKCSEADVFLIAFVSSALFPIFVPLGLLVLWVISIIEGPFAGDKERAECEKLKKEIKSLKSKVNTQAQPIVGRLECTLSAPQESKPKFKVGDLITGVEGNPAGYTHLYEGCVCRVLKVNGNKAMKVVLIDHVDKEAHKAFLGKDFKAPVRYFKKIKLDSNKTKKKSAKKSKK